MLKDKSEYLDKAALRQAVIYRLSKREHSRFELLNKLSKRAESMTELEEILDDMVERGWQSDERYAEIFSRDRSLRYGPIKIRFELRNRGIHESLIDLTIEGLEVDWYQKAREHLLRKFDQTQFKQDLKLKAKAYRFLAQRGFTSDQINSAISS